MTDDNLKRSQVGLAAVAEAAGVSKMTASRVLRNAAGVAPATRARVMAEVDRLGYVPNKLAAAFGSETASTLIGVSVPRLVGAMFGEVVEATDRVLSRVGYQTLIGTTDNSPMVEEAWLRALLAWRPAGLILTGRRRSKAAQEMLRSTTAPVIEIWDLNTRATDGSVGFSHADSGYEMGRYMVGRGRRKIGYVGAEADSPGMGEARRGGFEQALIDGGHPLTDSHILHDQPSFYAGLYGTETLLARRCDLDAIYFQNDAMAIGGLFFLQARGIGVPEDIGIAGWGGMEVTSVLPRRLTTTSIATRGVGKTAAEMLIARLRGEPFEEVVQVPTRLVPGATL